MLKKYKLAITVFFIAIALVAVKVALIYYKFNELNIGSLTTAFITGTIFLIGFLLAGTLSDFKESEKLPSDLSVSLKSLHDDFKLASAGKKELYENPMRLIKELNLDVYSKLRKGENLDKEVLGKINKINDQITIYANSGIAANYIIKLRNELVAVEKIVKRIKTIKETSFIPAAYAIVEILVGITIIMLVASKIGNIYESSIVLFSIPLLMIYMVMLIKDMDDPFEPGGIADVDLSPLASLEKYFSSK